METVQKVLVIKEEVLSRWKSFVNLKNSLLNEVVSLCEEGKWRGYLYTDGEYVLDKDKGIFCTLCDFLRFSELYKKEISETDFKDLCELTLEKLNNEIFFDKSMNGQRYLSDTTLILFIKDKKERSA